MESKESATLDDRYELEEGRVHLSGVQALVRLLGLQHESDRRAGIHSAGFVTGYRGSPLGGVDAELSRSSEWLTRHDVVFSPGVNEELAATAVWGTQQVPLLGDSSFDGVYSMWYGKSPGVDRSADAIMHGNAAGTSWFGGVLLVAGDDPGAKSSTLANRSESVLAHCAVPVLFPADVQDILDFGMFGWQMSRHSGSWVALKLVVETADAAATVSVHRNRYDVRPDGPKTPEGVSIGFDLPPRILEQLVNEVRVPAAQELARHLGLDRQYFLGNQLGIVCSGKTYLDVRQALDKLGIDAQRAEELGLSLMKLALIWPADHRIAQAFAIGRSEVLVIEEKHPFIEEQWARALINLDAAPRLVGKSDLDGSRFVPASGELNSSSVETLLRRWLRRVAPEFAVPPVEREGPIRIAVESSVARSAGFCSGCPHNTSTVVPEGSVAMGGIGCHGMAAYMPERRTRTVTQMGGEGALWIGQSPFTDTQHVFQNIGDGTFFHSGILAVRAAVAANVSVTFKVLANGAIAMTGGQEIEGESFDSAQLIPDIVAMLQASKVERVVVVNETGENRYGRKGLPSSVAIRHRNDLDELQRELRDVQAVTAIVYDQSCAAEVRKRRKRGQAAPPIRTVVINERVCEGCGDCNVQSNCISIVPVETIYGRKRQVDQSTCNYDESCLRGYCPSFVAVRGTPAVTSVIALASPSDELLENIPEPVATESANVVFAGIGGTGIVTAASVTAMAAHLQGMEVSVLNQTGMAQKNGPVSSHLRVAKKGAEILSRRVPAGLADLVIASDAVYASSPDITQTMSRHGTSVIVNSTVTAPMSFATNPDLDLTFEPLLARIREAAMDTIVCDADGLTSVLLGSPVTQSIFMLGVAFQRGLMPINRTSFRSAIEMNRAAVGDNLRSFELGRLWVADRSAFDGFLLQGASSAAEEPKDLDSIVAARRVDLAKYQNARYAQRYEQLVRRVEGNGPDDRLAAAVALNYYKVLAYKDEYEVARLYSDGTFYADLVRQFSTIDRLRFYLAPQQFPSDPRTGRVKKVALPGLLMRPGFKVLASMKALRGTPLDFFGRTAHRRSERALIAEYEETVALVLAKLNDHNYEPAVELASFPEHIRGYGVIKDAAIKAWHAQRPQSLEALESETSAGVDSL